MSMWGIQVKTFDNKNYFPYRSYVKLKKVIVNDYEKGVPPPADGNKNFTWNATYAYYHMLAKVSDNLIAALGPVTAGVLLGNKFYLMSDFVARHMFRYTLIGEKKSNEDKKSIGSGVDLKLEITPRILSSELFADKNLNEGYNSYQNYGITRGLFRQTRNAKKK